MSPGDPSVGEVSPAGTLAAGRTRSGELLRWESLGPIEIVLLVGLLASLVLLRPSREQGFTTDESRWISSSRYFWTTFLDRNLSGPDWQPNYVALTHPPVGRYLIGLGLWLQGWSADQLVGRYTSTRSREYNQAVGNVPSPQLLRAGRRVTFVFAVGSVVLLYLVGRQLGGAPAGFAAAALAAVNPLLATLWTRTLGESVFAFFALLALLLALRTTLRPGADRWRLGPFIAVGTALGLATATKLTGGVGAVGLAAFALIQGLLVRGAKPRVVLLLRWLGLGLAASTVFIMVNPLLYPDPIGRAGWLIQHRRDEMQQQRLDSAARATQESVDARLALTFERVFATYSSAEGPLRLPAPLEPALAAVGLLVIVSRTAGEIFRSISPGPATLFLCWLILPSALMIVNLGLDSSHYCAPFLVGSVLLEGVALSRLAGWLSGLQRRPLGRSIEASIRAAIKSWPEVGLGALMLVAVYARLTGLDVALTTDEGHWMQRTVRFGAALARGDLPSTLRSGHPGVSVMWTGLVGIGPARLEPLMDSQLLQEEALQRAVGYLEALSGARTAVVAVTSGLLVLSAWLLGRLVGAGAGLFAGALLSLDPYVVGSTRLLHPDALLAPLVTVSMLAGLAYWLGKGGKTCLVISALSGGLALLTKAPAVAVVVFWFVLALLVRRRPFRQRIASAAAWAALGIAAFVVCWPALWVDPLTTLLRVAEFVRAEGGAPHEGQNFFLGQPTATDPGALFYPVALAFRLGPLLLLGLLALPLTVRRWPERAAAVLWIFGFAFLFLVMMTLGAKKFDRYALPAIVPLVLLGGVGLWSLVQRLGRPHLRGLAVLAAIVIQAGLLWQSQPYPIATFNPLLGGASGARQNLLVGWGEGLEQTAAYLNSLPSADDRIATTAYSSVLRPRFRGRTTFTVQQGPADYYVLYINTLQRDDIPPRVRRVMLQSGPEFTAYVQGVPYAWVYGLTSQPAADAGSGDQRNAASGS